MARDTLTGTRIRERRMQKGLRQAALAEAVGISGPYLNLIEHNRRRIGGTLLNRIAAALGVEPVMLSEGAQATLVLALQEVAAGRPAVPAETGRAEEFAGRFPGWAELLTELAGENATLERTVEALADRLSHDPQLAASLHEVLSTVTAIRSTAAILAEPGEIEPEWRDRFHRNINEDAARLAQSSQALVRYLDNAGEVQEGGTISPEEEVEAFHDARGHHHPELEAEAADAGTIEAMLPAGLGPQARYILTRDLRHYLEAAQALPLARLAAHLAEAGPAPLDLAERAGVGVATVLRRLAAAPAGMLDTAHGLVISDAAGAFLYRKPLPDFAVPRFGAGCALWPLYATFAQPLSVIRETVHLAGREGGAFECFATSEPQGAPGLGRPPALVSVMLMRPLSAQAHAQAQAQAQGGVTALREMGVSCRICPARDCLARRAPAIQSEGL